jgi:NAD(P)-dependent dehydrogenase (short-subunit alcohol dehydrogenase family)
MWSSRRVTERLLQVKEEIEALGQRAAAIAYDQTSDKSVWSMKDKALKAFGHVDILISNAAAGIKGRLEATTMDDWRFMVETNLLGYVRCVQAFLPHFIERRDGYIVTVSTIQALGFTGEAMNIPYITTKAGILGLTESLLGYLGPKGVKVSCLCPGGVTTDMAVTARYVGTEEEKLDMKAKDIEFHKSPFFSSPEQIAAWLLAGMQREDYIILAPLRWKTCCSRRAGTRPSSTGS